MENKSLTFTFFVRILGVFADAWNKELGRLGWGWRTDSAKTNVREN